MMSDTHTYTCIDILIDSQGQLKLSDFGAAKILAKGQKTMGRTTMNMNVNSLAGTPMYMVSKQDLYIDAGDNEWDLNLGT